MNPNRFFLNSDYTSEKISGVYTIEMYRPPTTMSSYDVQTYTKDIEVPKGLYFEDIFFDLSLAPDSSIGGPFVYYESGHFDGYTITGIVYHYSATKYRLEVIVENQEDNSLTVPEFRIKAKVHLSVAP